VFLLGWSVAMVPLPGVDLARLLLDAGFIDALVSAMRAFELRGPNSHGGR
jgi:hypothetical protein